MFSDRTDNGTTFRPCAVQCVRPIRVDVEIVSGKWCTRIRAHPNARIVCGRPMNCASYTPSYRWDKCVDADHGDDVDAFAMCPHFCTTTDSRHIGHEAMPPAALTVPLNRRRRPLQHFRPHDETCEILDSIWTQTIWRTRRTRTISLWNASICV